MNPKNTDGFSKMEFQNAISGVTAFYLKNYRDSNEKPFNLSVAAIKGREVQVFENIPFIILKHTNQVYEDNFAQIEESWIKSHPEWTFGSVFRDFMTLDISYKHRKLFWGKDKKEALNVLIYCMNESLKETEDKIIELNKDASYFRDISYFAQKLKEI